MRPLINAGNDAACRLLFTDERGEAFKFFFPPHLLYHLCRLQGEKINAFVIKWRGKNGDKVLAHGGTPPFISIFVTSCRICIEMPFGLLPHTPMSLLLF